jgi:hypothetical protein
LRLDETSYRAGYRRIPLGANEAEVVAAIGPLPHDPDRWGLPLGDRTVVEFERLKQGVPSRHRVVGWAGVAADPAVAGADGFTAGAGRDASRRADGAICFVDRKTGAVAATFRLRCDGREMLGVVIGPGGVVTEKAYSVYEEESPFRTFVRDGVGLVFSSSGIGGSGET